MTSDDTKSFSEDRRERTRYPVRMDVNYRHGDTYLFSRTANLSELGIFLVSESPKPVETVLYLEFRLGGAQQPIAVKGRVAWVEPGHGEAESGMGIQFLDLRPEVQRQIKSLIRTMAFIDD